MSDERYPRPWGAGYIGEDGTNLTDANDDFIAVIETDDPSLSHAAFAAALVGAVNAADPALPLEQVLANLAAGKLG